MTDNKSEGNTHDEDRSIAMDRFRNMEEFVQLGALRPIYPQFIRHINTIIAHQKANFKSRATRSENKKEDPTMSETPDTPETPESGTTPETNA